MDPNKRQLRNIAVLAVLLLLIGAFAFSVAEKISYGEGLYRSIYIMLSHHDNFHDNSWLGRITVLSLILTSLLIIAYLLKSLAEYMIMLGDGLKKRQMKTRIAHMKDHYIVCGLGRVGIQVARELNEEDVSFVAVDSDEEKVKAAIAAGYVAVVADCTDEQTLQETGIERAVGLVGALGTDSANLLVSLAARQLNERLYIVARANKPENQKRILRAGANQVTMPYAIGGFHMANMVVRPNMVDFLEVLSSNDHKNLQIAEFVIPDGSAIAGQKLEWLTSHDVRATVLAINTVDGVSKVHPSGSETIYSGDKLILMGTHIQIQNAANLV